jgi:hypothetical protein
VADVSSNRSASTRRSVEQRSAVLLVYLGRLPRWVPMIALAAVMVAGLVVRGPVGAAALCLVAAFVAWLGYLSWPRLAGAGRFGRVVVVALLLALAAFEAAR